MAKRILVESDDGLHCLSLETGAELWHFGPTANGTAVINGNTPAVDQANGFIYYQSITRLWKLNATTGAYIDHAVITTQTLVAQGNTILVNDANGYFIVCYYYANTAYGGAVKVFDENLDLVWEATGLNTVYKNCIAYHDGSVFIGTGEIWDNADTRAWYTGQQEDCRVISYDVTDGSVNWTCVLSDPVDKIFEPGGYGVTQVLYCNGYVIAIQESVIETCPVKVRVIDNSDGSILKTYTGAAWSQNCGQPVLSYGRIFQGSTNDNKVTCFQLGTGAKDDFAPFGVHKTNTDEAPDTALASLDEDITLIGTVSGCNQGGVVHEEIVYFVNEGTGGVVAFNIDTLEVIRTYESADLWDSSPMIVKNLAGEDILLVKEYGNQRVKAMLVSDGSTLWYSDNNMAGLFFGFTYYDSTYFQFEQGISDESAIAGLNANFTALNVLIANAATIVTITSAVQWDDINANIASLNAEGVAVAVETITVGMTGTQLNNIINGFVSDFAAAN